MVTATMMEQSNNIGGEGLYPATIVIRRARFIDVDTLAELVTQLGYPTDADEMIVRLRTLLTESNNHLVAVAELSGKVVGVISAALSFHIEHAGAYGRITALSVDEKQRRQGIGAALLAYAESWLLRHGATVCIVNSHLRRLDAHRFYEREGYRNTGYRLEKHYPKK